MTQIKYILITGSKQHGKDTFFDILNQLYPNEFSSFAHADSLKEDLLSFVKEKFNIDIINCSGTEKEFIRPLMITYAEMHRHKDPNHWVKVCAQKTETTDKVCVIKDNRYENEILYFKNKYPDQCVVVQIKRIDGPEPTDAEKLSLPSIESHIDYKIEWPTVEDKSELYSYVQKFHYKYF